ncbi:MAG: fatty acid desaturase [Phycisphaerae bacterium]|nr:fatty acid desaturase [Phycisphaerae bacterium]
MSVSAASPPRLGPYRPYRATLLTPERVRELSRLRPWRPVVDTAWNWALILAAWALVAVDPTWWAALLAIPIVGTRYYALFIIGHDGMHRRIFNRVRPNDLFTDLFILGPIGAITRINNRNHLEHHKHLASTLDPDRHKHACFNKATRPRYLAFLSGLANLWPVVKHVFFRDAGGPHAADAPARATSKPNYTPRDVAILLGWQAALIGGLSFGVAWWAFPVLWLAPVYIFVYLGDLVRSFLEHSHPEADDKADEHRLITYTSNPIERMLFSPMNMNYHIPHHLWPSIPYYNLPIADREIRHKPEAEGLVWRRSYLGYLLRYYFALPLPECQERPGVPA